MKSLACESVGQAYTPIHIFASFFYRRSQGPIQHGKTLRTLNDMDTERDGNGVSMYLCVYATDGWLEVGLWSFAGYGHSVGVTGKWTYV